MMSSFLDKLQQLADTAMKYAEEQRDPRVPNIPAVMEYQIGHIRTAIKEERERQERHAQTLDNAGKMFDYIMDHARAGAPYLQDIPDHMSPTGRFAPRREPNFQTITPKTPEAKIILDAFRRKDT
jgi:hypothetical protein